MRSFVLVVCLLLAVVCISTTLSGCTPDESEVDVSSDLDDPPDDVGAESQVSISAPTNPPETIVYVDPLNYVYNKEISSSLDIGILYPSHWLKETGKSTIVYKQPVNDGEIPARISITTRKAQKTPTTEKMAELIEEFTGVVAKQYDDFVPNDILTDIMFIKRPAFHRTYEGTLGGVPVKGFIIITCNTKKGRLYVLHFSAPASEYDAMNPVLEEIVGKVVILSK